MEWLNCIKSGTSANGCMEAQDDQGNPLFIEWIRAGILSPELAAFKRQVSDLASSDLASTEVEFLQKHPEAAHQELFLKACIPLLEQRASQELLKEKIQSTIKQFYLTDLSKFSPEIIHPLMNDLYFCASIQSKEEPSIRGFLMFAITPALPFGDIKVISLTTRSKECGLEKALLNSIFTLIPKTKRIFLFVRPTNEAAIQLYQSLGFTQDLAPFQDPNHKVDTKYLIPLEYKRLPVN